ncbi:MAG: DMT family transporter [Candidatus Marsarchaeota archaeon]|nr:DMT family transporter [Candidatus Marsarchaeota archaeon]
MTLMLGIVFAIITMFAYGIADAILADVVKKFGVVWTSGWYFLVTSLVFIPLILYFGISPIPGYYVVLLIVVLALISVLGILSFNEGLKVGHPSVIIPIAASASVVTVVLSVIFFHESLTLVAIVGIALIIMGGILSSFKLHHLLKARSKNLSKGVQYAALTMVSWGLFYFLLSDLTHYVGWLSAAFFFNTVSVLFIFIMGIGKHRKVYVPKGKGTKLIVLAGILNAIAVLSFNLGVTQTFTSIVTPIVAADAVVAVLLALVWLKDKPTHNQLIGIAMVLLGVIIVSL